MPNLSPLPLSIIILFHLGQYPFYAGQADAVLAEERLGAEVEVEGDSAPNSDDEVFGPNISTYPTYPVLECGIWLAPSAIPGAGLGMYAGRDFKKGELLQEVGDLCIPIIDLVKHNLDEEFNFLWDEYTWSADAIGAQHEGYHDVNAASPGFGSAANSFLPAVNVEELYPHRDYVGLHRSRDPGAGAFSPYYDRGSMAERDIKSGEELYVSYGEDWFMQRDYLGPIPLEKDLGTATVLFKSFSGMKKRLSRNVQQTIFDDLWKTFVINSPYNNTSRVFGGFHHSDKSEMEQLKSGKSLSTIRVEEAIRSKEWLQRHGTCGDHIRAGPSTLPQAGHGAFASRDLPEGTVVAQLPLIHVTDRSRFNMYHFSKEDPTLPSPEAGERPPQLLLNYCYGHKESTLLLCPYGPVVNLINHNQSQANVKIVWGDPKRGNFMPHALNRSLPELEINQTAKLAFDLVSTRPIAKGDEVFLDYGDEWEGAWQKHADSWTPVEGAKDYRNVEQLNEALTKNEIKLHTEFEYLHNDTLPRLPFNVDLACNSYFSDYTWRHDFEAGKLAEELKAHSTSAEFLYCRVLRTRRHQVTREIMYTVEVRDDTDENQIIWNDCPSSMFHFVEKPYTTDILLENAFRHDIRIPDEEFPKLWRNLAPGYSTEEKQKEAS